ncbi:hypothetical protein [Actinophytocola sp. NPDC049390]|uniref:hypothetical protein n=1 Tax=Actinophytocola sp. NPDC049390 TaxID=3363894 RepID=UPI0037A8B51A
MQATAPAKPVTAEEILAEYEVTLPARAAKETCSYCGGSGTVQVSDDRRDGDTTCPSCGGTGEH